VQFQVATVSAFERGGDIALERQAAALAKGWSDGLHELAAFGADKTLLRSRRFILAQGANLGIKQAQRGAEGGLGQPFHGFSLIGAINTFQKFLNKSVATVFPFAIFSVPF
jgi:hypothetical protein